MSLALSNQSTEFVAGYRAIARLSRGDLCDVYEVWSQEREAGCVMKILRPDRRAYAPDRRRVVAEGELLMSLSHPHIVRAYEVREDPVPFIVLEKTDGPTLADMIERGPLSLRDVARIATQLCSALAYLHRRGYVRLDQKPSNVAYDRGHVRVLDISTLRRPGGRDQSEATDALGLGCLLYEAATCRGAFRPDGTALMATPPFKKSGRLLPATSSIIMRSLSAVPENRPSVAEIARIFAPLV